MRSQRHTTSNQRWNKVVHVNIEIYNAEQRRNNVVYFNVELNNVRQSRNKVVIFNVDFHNVGLRRNNLANMTIWKKIKPRFKKNSYFWASKNMRDWTSSLFFPFLIGICKRIFAESQKFLKHQIYWIAKTIFKRSHFVNVSWFLASKCKFKHIMIIAVLVLYIF